MRNGLVALVISKRFDRDTVSLDRDLSMKNDASDKVGSEILTVHNDTRRDRTHHVIFGFGHYVVSPSLLLLVTLACPQTGWCIEASMIANEVQEHEAPQLRLVRELQIPGLIGSVSRVFWRSDGSRLAAANTRPSGDLLIMQVPNAFGRQVTIWDAAGTLLKQISRSDAFFNAMDNLAFVEGNKKIVAPPSMLSNNLAFSVFDVESDEIVHEVAGSHPDRARNVNALANFAVSPDESILAVVFGRALPQPVALYSTRDWSKIGDLADTPKNIVEEPLCLAFSDDGHLLAVGGFRKILIYDVQTRQRVQLIEAFPGSRPDFIRFAEGDRVIITGASYVPYVPRKYIYAFSIEDGAPLASHNSGGTAYDSTPCRLYRKKPAAPPVGPISSG